MGMVLCHCGELHFGWYGAAGLVLVDEAGRVLMTHRSAQVHRPGTWAFPGGALVEGEEPTAAAVREAVEEVGLPAERIRVVGTFAGLDHEVWRYTYVLATTVPGAAALELYANWEAVAVEWVAIGDVAELPLHPDLGRDWSELRAALRRLSQEETAQAG
jgi:8-oxo-dGTP diphosphatase